MQGGRGGGYGMGGYGYDMRRYGGGYWGDYGWGGGAGGRGSRQGWVGQQGYCWIQGEMFFNHPSISAYQ